MMATNAQTTHPPNSTKTLATPRPSRYRSLINKFSKTSRTQHTTTHQPKSDLTAHSQSSQPATPSNIKFPTLQTLPTELLLQINSLLTPVDTICLRATNHSFHTTLPTIATTHLNECHHWLLACRYERDLISARGGTITHRDVKRLACAYCKRTRLVKDFTGGKGSGSVVSGLRGMWKKPVGSGGGQEQGQQQVQAQQQGQVQLQAQAQPQAQTQPQGPGQAQGQGQQQGQTQPQTHPDLQNRTKKPYFPDPQKLSSAPEQHLKPHVVVDAPICATCAHEADEVDAEDGPSASSTLTSSSSSSSSSDTDDDDDASGDADDAASFYAPEMAALGDDSSSSLALAPDANASSSISSASTPI